MLSRIYTLATWQSLTHVDMNVLGVLMLQFVKSFENLYFGGDPQIHLLLDGVQLPNYEIILVIFFNLTLPPNDPLLIKRGACGELHNTFPSILSPCLFIFASALFATINIIGLDAN